MQNPTAEQGIAASVLSAAGRGRRWIGAPAMFAMAYPYFLKGYFLNLPAQGAAGAPWVSALLLALAFAVPLLGLMAALRLGRVARTDGALLWGKRLALLTVAAPPIYTAAGVLLYMAGDPIADTTAWLLLWGVLAATGVAAALRSSQATMATPVAATPAAGVPARLRVAHGVSALAIAALFLAMHLSNHMAGLVGEAAHRQLMDLFRAVYRAQLVEPLIVLLFLFQVASGLALLRFHTTRPADFFRTLQLASGAYLVFFILAHMNSVFLYARRFANIKTDWDFATGAPAGLLHDAWNIRLVPHYYLGVFLVLAHLALGARIVALNHGASRSAADRWTKAGIAASALAAFLIMLGMSGVHPL
jgi:hypothetical protein